MADFFVGKMAFQMDDRLPISIRIFPDCLLYNLLDFSDELVIPLNMRAAGGRQLQQHKLLSKLRELLKESVDGHGPLDYSLGVVDPVNTHAHDFILQTEL